MAGHDATVSAFKAVCIILMVIGHSQCPEWLCRFIYLFHMPAFFFISGYLLSDGYLSGTGTVGFVKRKLKGLYLPFVFWSLVFLALTNPFHSIGLVDYTLQPREMLSRAFKSITFRGHQPLLNGYWFLKTLFFSSILSVFLLRFVEKRSGLVVAGAVLLAALCVFIPDEGHMVSRTFLAAAFYVSGRIWRRSGLTPGWSLSLAALAILGGVSLVFDADILSTGWRAVAYYPVGLIGSAAVLGLCRYLKGGPARLLDFIGRGTLDILTFHLLCFRLLDLLLPSSAQGAWTWMLYTLAGVGIPLLASSLRGLLESVKPRRHATG